MRDGSIFDAFRYRDIYSEPREATGLFNLLPESFQMFEMITDVEAEYPEGVTGMVDLLTGEFTQFKNVCDNCREVMLLAWGKDCPICGDRMRRVFLGRPETLP